METAHKFNEGITIDLAPGIIPEWEVPNEVVVVWPERLRAGVSKLKPFYKSFINQLSSLVPVRILAYREIDKELLLSIFERPEMINISHLHISDIWINDYMPLPQRPKDGRSVLKPLYAPSYLKDRSEIYAADGNNAAIIFSDLLRYDVAIPQNEFGVPLVLDGGNIITNGKDRAICSNRIITDNETWSIEQLHSVFNRTFGISKLILLPVEPENIKAHVSNLVRFIDAQNVIVADYQDGYMKEFMDTIATRLNSHELEVHRVKNVLAPARSDSKYRNTKGNFLTYLRLGNSIFLPAYDGLERETEAAAKVYRSIGLTVFTVSNVDELAEIGGGLNAIAWTAF